MIKPWQIRAIRAAINWSQGQLAKKAGLTQPTISGLEKGEIDSPGTKAMNAIATACESEGFYFTDNGIEKKEANTYTIEGDDCYLRLLKIAQMEMSAGDFFLKRNADERRSSPEVIAQLQAMRNDGILFQSIIRADDTFVMGELGEYRCMDTDHQRRGDVILCFGDCVAYLVTWTDPAKVVVVQDQIIAADARNTFQDYWKRSCKLKESSAPIRFDGVGNG